jgi:hypothetical protein
MAQHNQLGKQGELIARKMLEEKGWKIRLVKREKLRDLKIKFSSFFFGIFLILFFCYASWLLSYSHAGNGGSNPPGDAKNLRQLAILRIKGPQG